MDDQQKQLAEELFFGEKKTFGFAKHLYFGRFESSIAFPYPQAPKENLETFFENLKKFVDDEIDPDWIDRNAEIPERVINGLGQMGVLGMTIPKEYGGLGLSQYAYCRTAEMVSARCASTALFINAHQSVGLKAIVLFGTEKQKKHWLKPLAQGKQIAAFSLTEPNAGSDASGIETRAVYKPEKNLYLLNGKKQWTTNGSLAGIFTVMAKTEIDTPKGKQDKITAFLVTPDMPGFKILAPALEKVGMRGTKTTNLEFTNMEVPAENILGPIGGGLKVCLTVLDYGRTTFGATCTGVAKVLLSDAVRHAKTRYQFHRPLGSFGLVKKKIARIAALVYAMDATTYFTAGFIDAQHEDIMLESAMLKVFTSEALWSILYDTMQIYGGRSFFTDHPYERMMRDARLNMIGEGSNEVMRAFIGAVGMRDVGVELKTIFESSKHPFKNWNILEKVPKELLRRFKTIISVESSALKLEAQLLAKSVQKFGFAIVRLLAHYREEIIENQMELERIADSAIALYTATAVLTKLDTAIKLNPNSISKQEILSGKFYLHMAFKTIQQNLDAIFSHQDQLADALSDLMTGIHPS